jgi:hypothetical protein
MLAFVAGETSEACNMSTQGVNMQAIEKIQRKLFVLRNYETVFNGEAVRQVKPICCGLEYGLAELLKAVVHPSAVEIDGNSFTLFEVTCHACGQKIPPQWNVKGLKGELI